MEDLITKWFDFNIDAISADILDLVAVRSISDDREKAHAALGLILEKARALGFSTRLEVNGEIGIAEIRYSGGNGDRDASKETLGIFSHVDVADPGEASEWSHDPWGERGSDALWGRGCIDNKGPLLLCLWAVKALVDLHVPFYKTVRFIIGSMGELDSKDIHEYKKIAQLPDYGFTPHGSFPVVNREKGHCDISLSFPFGLNSMIGEWRIISLDSERSIDGVSESAVAIVEPLFASSFMDKLEEIKSILPEEEMAKISFTALGKKKAAISVTGDISQSGLCGTIDNSIMRLFAFLSKLGVNNLTNFTNQYLGNDCLAILLCKQSCPEALTGDYLGQTTAYPDLLKTENGVFELRLKLRTSLGQTEDEVKEVFAALGERCHFTAEIGRFIPAILIPQDRPFMMAMMAAYEWCTGLRGDFVSSPGLYFARAIPQIASFGPVFPGHPDLYHKPNERLTFKELILLGQIYTNAIGAIISSDTSFA